VILEGKLAKDQHELIAPAVEVAGVDVEDDHDVSPHVVDGDRLGMQVQEGQRLVKQHGGVEVGGRRSCCGGLASVEAAVAATRSVTPQVLITN
jgi:hypothetical protein